MSSVQVIRFPVAEWSFAQASQWVHEHGFMPIKITREGQKWNFRLEDPAHFDHFATKEVRSGSQRKTIYLVIGFLRPRPAQGDLGGFY